MALKSILSEYGILEKSEMISNEIVEHFDSLRVSYIVLLEHLICDKSDTDFRKKEIEKILPSLLCGIENLKALCFAVELIIDRFEICEKSASNCFEANERLEAIKRIYYKIK